MQKRFLLLLLLGLAFSLSGCAKVADSYINFVNNNPVAQKLNPYNRQGSIETIKADKSKKIKKSSKEIAKSHNVLKKTAVKKEKTPAKAQKTNKEPRSGLMGWYMDAVDNSPLNPYNSHGGLPQPVKDAMQMQGMK